MDGTVRILIVDDDVRFCEVICRLLKSHGYVVTTCSNGRQVTDLLRKEPYACVLLDIGLPGLEGTELLPIIKHNFQTLPVILMSGRSNPDATYYVSLGACEFLAKPFDPNVLVAAVDRAIGGTQSIPLVLTSLSLVEAQDLVYRKLIVTALRKADWNQVKAAQLLGISRQKLIRWLRKLEISY